MLPGINTDRTVLVNDDCIDDCSQHDLKASNAATDNEPDGNFILNWTLVFVDDAEDEHGER